MQLINVCFPQLSSTELRNHLNRVLSVVVGFSTGQSVRRGNCHEFVYMSMKPTGKADQNL